MLPKLAEILGLENPFEQFLELNPELATTEGEKNLKVSARAWNCALENVGDRLEALRVSGKDAGTVGYAGPGWLLWIPENKVDELADQDSLEAQEMFECVG